MHNITRDNISEFINNEFGLPKKDCDDIVNELIEQIIVGLINHKIFISLIIKPVRNICNNWHSKIKFHT